MHVQNIILDNLSYKITFYKLTREPLNSMKDNSNIFVVVFLAIWLS